MFFPSMIESLGKDSLAIKKDSCNPLEGTLLGRSALESKT